MKTLKFRNELSKLILENKKNATWRLFDDKNIAPGDEVSLRVWETKKEFARAKIISAIEKPLGNLTDADWEGHEKFDSDKEMYATYEKYYNRKIDKNTLCKIIKFELIRE